MVKRQKEKQYQSAREHKANSQIRAGRVVGGKTERRLPFHCCALTLTAFEDPVCTPQGILFDTTALLPFLLKHKQDPVTGNKLTSRDVIRLQMDKDEETGRWQCPVLQKPFEDHTKVVAIRHGNEANVYSWQAYHELNVKSKNLEDLVSGQKFSKKDVIILNDPDNDELNNLRDINNFHHIRTSSKDRKPSTNVQFSGTASRVMEKLAATKRSAPTTSKSNDKEETPIRKRPRIDAVNGKQMTVGMVSSSLTSSAMTVVHDNDTREATLEEVLRAQFSVMRRRKKKGYATVRTNMGDIGVELHCDISPRTCTNFLGLAEQKKYDGCKFHRLIPSFMIQGGKANDKADEKSLWGEPFKDEFDPRLNHDAEGILSSANAGPRTNTRQFFFTFGAASHLDRKHSVFGRVIEGMDILREMKKVPTDSKDRPVHEIIINTIEVLVNPAKEAEELESKRIEEYMARLNESKDRLKSKALGKQPGKSAGTKVSKNVSEPDVVNAPKVGKYLAQKMKKNATVNKGGIEDELPTTKASRLPPPPKKSNFGNFSSW